MDSIASEKEGVNSVKKIGKWIKTNEMDIAVFLAILLGVLLILGLIRLRTLTPTKEPIKIDTPSVSI